ncbi:hypothetical protein [Labrys wisconsinensis]|uniref:Uncharacterized protein n=1 Tax=Labrys wisconsinensis TaxID=425677 RepID=A0ABU0J0U8_9HYPH|nr:hypothetical protein [Labrys wisconsinensis]MDQ0467890.1 hypothetical protein [Labrys wisconsinensis]
MTASRSWSLLDAAAEVHRPGCPSLSGFAATPADAMPDGAPDAVVAYGLEARRVYSDLRRLIGQTAGLLILAQASRRREALDLPTLAGAQELWGEVAERLGGLSAPQRLDPNLRHLIAAHRLAGSCLTALRAPVLADGAPDLTVALGNLTAAYRHLQAASEERLGMTMVDFRHSCCNCNA